MFRGVIHLRRGRKKLAMVFLGLAITPFIHYTYQTIQSNFEADFRQTELNNLSKRKINPQKNQPRAMLAQFSAYDKELQALVATGILNEVQQQLTERYTKKKRVRYYTPIEGDECIDFKTLGGEHAEYRRVVLARYAFQRCAKEEDRDGVVDAPIELLKDEYAPNKYNGPACLGGGNNPLELRWTKEHGGELISFWESPSYMTPLFPPVLLGYQRVWFCDRIQPWDERYHRPDTFRFVANAFGYNTVDDFPRHPDETIVPSVLKKLIPKLKSAYANNHVIALLGQWPSTPEIDNILNDPEMVKASNAIISKATKLLTDEKEKNHLNNYYPYLLTHLKSFNKMCKQGIMRKKYNTGNHCDKLSHLLLNYDNVSITNQR